MRRSRVKSLSAIALVLVCAGAAVQTAVSAPTGHGVLFVYRAHVTAAAGGDVYDLVPGAACVG